jgi:hypothetical protein
MDGLCIYEYQLATQVDKGEVHLSQKSDSYPLKQPKLENV